MIGDPTEKVVSGSGTIFYINNIAQAIAKDFSNPITRFAMTEYPQDGQKCMSELRNGRKWLVDLPRELLTATAHVNNKLYFVGELLMCRDGGPPIDILFALGHMVQETTDGFVAGEMAVIPTSNFKETFEDLRDAGYLACGFSECSKSYEAQMPHPQREFANGHMIYGVPLIIFLDDVSGNISKQWNKHHAIYMSNALLPRKMIEKEFCTRFVTSSPHASPMELVKALKDSIGQAGTPRTPGKTKSHINEQIRLTSLHGAADKLKTQKSTTGVNDSMCRKALQAIVELGKAMYAGKHPGSSGMEKEDVQKKLENEVNRVVEAYGINPLIGMPGVDIHQDTPTEILHTVLLGVVKYFWGQTAHILDKKKTFSHRGQAPCELAV
ncbi:hypothetical protein PQX77_019637 [Marasmius sp. AFHP31]|nr:hypothetical protein PQX77_019637 [Marasmius sp. AFHP31]